MSGFTKTCIYCNKEIRLSNDLGRWLPFNLDNSPHECKKQSGYTQQQPQQQQKQVQEHKSNSTSTLSFEEINDRLRRLEKAVFGTN
jgi:hypothetical protein